MGEEENDLLRRIQAELAKEQNNSIQWGKEFTPFGDTRQLEEGLATLATYNPFDPNRSLTVFRDTRSLPDGIQLTYALEALPFIFNDWPKQIPEDPERVAENDLFTPVPETEINIIVTQERKLLCRQLPLNFSLFLEYEAEKLDTSRVSVQLTFPGTSASPVEAGLVEPEKSGPYNAIADLGYKVQPGGQIKRRSLLLPSNGQVLSTMKIAFSKSAPPSL